MTSLVIIFMITMLSKLSIHFYLDFTRKDNRNFRSYLMGVGTLELFLWYFHTVDSRYILLKNICNLFYLMSVILLIITISIR